MGYNRQKPSKAWGISWEDMRNGISDGSVYLKMGN
jgi:hypothetical protein